MFYSNKWFSFDSGAIELGAKLVNLIPEYLWKRKEGDFPSRMAKIWCSAPSTTYTKKKTISEPTNHPTDDQSQRRRANCSVKCGKYEWKSAFHFLLIFSSRAKLTNGCTVGWGGLGGGQKLLMVFEKYGKWNFMILRDKNVSRNFMESWSPTKIYDSDISTIFYLEQYEFGDE